MSRANPWKPALVVGLLLALVPAARAGSPTLKPDEQRRAEELLRQLGAPSFPERERASERLLKMGLAVKPVLDAGARDSDPEVRRRCRELLPAVEEADRRERLAAFLADKEGKREHDLPGWRRYRRIVGNDPAARELFIAIQRSESNQFLADIEKQPRRAAEQFEMRCRALQQRMYGGLPGVSPEPLTPVDVAPLYLVACDAELRVPPLSAMPALYFLYQPGLRQAMSAGPTPFKKLVLTWMNQQTDDTVVQQMLHLTNNLNLPEGLDLALRALRARTLKGPGLATAITTVGKLGNKSHVPLLEPFLADRTAVGAFVINTQVRGTTQVRDAALAMLVHLTGQSHKDYGFVFMQSNPWLKFHAHYMGFSSDEQRARALRKWQQWSAAQKK